MSPDTAQLFISKESKSRFCCNHLGPYSIRETFSVPCTAFYRNQAKEV